MKKKKKIIINWSTFKFIYVIFTVFLKSFNQTFIIFIVILLLERTINLLCSLVVFSHHIITKYALDYISVYYYLILIGKREFES